MPREKKSYKYERKPKGLGVSGSCCDTMSKVVEIRDIGKPGVVLYVYQCLDCGEMRSREVDD